MKTIDELQAEFKEWRISTASEDPWDAWQEATRRAAVKYKQEHEAWEWLAAHPKETLKKVSLNECRWLVMPAMRDIPWDALPTTPLAAVLMAAQLS